MQLRSEKLKIHMQRSFHQGGEATSWSVAGLLIVRSYTRSSNCMEEPATEYTQAMHTCDGQASNYYMYGSRGDATVWSGGWLHAADGVEW